MKALTKKTLAVFSVFLTPALFANTSLAAARAPMADFCNNFSQRANELNAKLQSKQAELDADSDQKKLQLKNVWEKRQAELEAARANNDQKLDARINVLTASAQNDSQKQAVNAFKASVSAAVTKRRQAIDLALKNFQNGMDGAINTFQARIVVALKNYKATVASAENKAKNECGKQNSNAVETAFEQNMRAAKQKFDTERKIEAFDKTIQNLKTARNESIKKADENFTADINQAAIALKNFFK